MKKIFVLAVLMLAVMITFLCSCGDGKTSDTTKGSNTTAKVSSDDITSGGVTSAHSITTVASTTATVTEEKPKDTTEVEEMRYPINGKTIIWLGSSVTYGSASGGQSMADVIRNEYDCTCIKEAVSGTTLVDNGPSSYVQRMLTIDKTIKADFFICQLSTNDATQNLPIGKVSASKNIDDFNTSTVAGAIEYIVSYASETFNCPVIFYTGTYYNSPNYRKMVELLFEIQEKWDIGIIDLWNDEEMKSISATDRKRFMADDIHPTLTGYKRWWTPKFVEYLEKIEYLRTQNDTIQKAKATYTLYIAEALIDGDFEKNAVVKVDEFYVIVKDGRIEQKLYLLQDINSLMGDDRYIVLEMTSDDHVSVSVVN